MLFIFKTGDDRFDINLLNMINMISELDFLTILDDVVCKLIWIICMIIHKGS